MDDKNSQTTDLSQVEFVSFEEYQEPGQADCDQSVDPVCQED